MLFSPGVRARLRAAAGFGLFVAAVGCSRILGLQQGAPVECLEDDNCVSPGQHCDIVSHTCVGSTPSDESTSPAPSSEGGSSSASAPDGAADDAGPLLVVPRDATDDMSDGCGLSSSGLCAACPGVNCVLERPGWTQPATTQFAEVAANTFDAVPVDIPNPSWLMRLGVDAANSNATGRLGLYKDSEGQPGDLVAQTDVTILYDPATHGTEVAVSDLLLCLPLDDVHYWVGAVFDSPVYVLSDGTTSTLRYEGAFADGGSLAGPLSGSIAVALQRNLYVVVTQSQP